jgi:hypothetical protein
MGSTTRQVFRIVLLALATASIGHAQQLAAPPAAPVTPADPAAEVKVAPDAPVMPPKVVCNGDKMTISASNSTLSSVLDEVHRCMGTHIDLPDGAGEKRMFDRLGPGPASEVIDEFLSATGYNYVIGSSPANQEKIESIMLLARSADASALPAIADGRPLTTNRRAFLQMHQASIPHPMTDADNAAAAAGIVPDPVPADAAAAPAPAATDPQPPPPADSSPVQPDTPATPATVVSPPPTTTGASPVQGGSTQDQITNMQQMFELRKQMNQNQNQNQNSNPPQP